MALPFFFIPVRAPEASEQELNSFQSSHKILTIDRHFVDQGSSSFWALRIDYFTIAFTYSDAPVTQTSPKPERVRALRRFATLLQFWVGFCRFD